MVTNGLTMKPLEMRKKAFDVFPVLASVSSMTYFLSNAVFAFVDPGNHLVPVKL